MKHLNICIVLLLMSVISHAQLVNNGGTITVQNGATLRVETSISNNAASTIINNGTIEVQNDLTNNGTFTSGTTSKVVFIGDVNSNVTSGDATFSYVEMKKDDENITLVDEMNISGTLDFVNANNQVIIGDNDLVILTGGNVANATPNRYVVTNGTGALVKGIDANGTLNFEVGTADHYTPVSCDIIGTAYTDATTRARVYNTGLTAKYTESTDYIALEWQIASSGITDYENTMTGIYNDDDVTGSKSFIKGAYYTTDWHFDGSTGDDADNEIVAVTDNTDVKFSGMNFFGKANLRAFLSGAMSSGANMTKLLNTNGLLPLTTPYTVAPFNAPTITTTAIPTEATDWILVEVRDAINPTTIISQTSAFILADGMIVNYDGTPLRLKNGVANGIIALRHRNHLPIRTESGLNLVNPTLKNFSSDISEAYTNSSITTNANMNLINGVYAMWAGDVNQDGYVRYIVFGIPPRPADSNLILTNALGGIPSGSLSGVYSNYDINLDNYVRYIVFGIPPRPADKDLILTQTLKGNPSNSVQRHF